MKKAPFFIAAGACLALAGVLRFALIGYGTLALFLAAAAVCLALYGLLPRKFRIMLTILIGLGLLVFAVGEVPVLRAAGGTPEFDADWLIVLGAGVNGEAPSRSMLDRLSAAEDYLRAHPDCKVILSGGQGGDERISEAEAMRRWLTARGMPEERILCEDQSRSTAENLANSLPLIPDGQRAAIAVCSSEYHLYRAQLLARREGYAVGAIPARTALPVLRLNYFLREGLGALYYHIVDRG